MMLFSFYVLLTDDNSPRNMWKLALVVETYPSDDNLVRSVKIKVSSKDIGQSLLDRPIHMKYVINLLLLIVEIQILYHSFQFIVID